MNTIRELKQQEKYKNMLKRKNKEKKIYKDKNASLQFEKQKLYIALLNREKEIERLNKQIEEYQKALDETVSEKVDLHFIINKIRNYVYKPIDKEWDDILCIIEDGLRGSDK